jgi:hypothetical protein
MLRDATFTDVSRAEALDDASTGFIMDEDAFRAFYERTARGVWTYLARITGDRQMADDLLQEAFYRFLRTAATHESEAHRRNSLDRIATNVARDARRRSLIRAPFSTGAECRLHARHVASQAARAGHVVAGVCRRGFASRDRGCARPASGQSESDVVSRAAKAGSTFGRQTVKLFECEFEEEVLAAALQSRVPEPLRAHVEACAICSDIAAIAGAIDEAREEMRAAAVIPDSGRVWWLGQMRARREATKTAGRPITAVQVIALACAVGLLGACFGATSQWFQSALGRIESALARFSASAFLAEHGLIVTAMAFVLLLVPGAVYLALGRE